jgi:hypothetical protein
VDRSKTIKDDIISHDIIILSEIFKRIDKKCGIIGFEHEKSYIDFLNVKSFIGSEIGAMNLMYPDEWEGPYLKDNPTVQEKLYQVVNTKDNYYIIPSNGVELSNGKIIGQDIILNKYSDIKEMIEGDGDLISQGRPLAGIIKVAEKEIK